MELLAMESQIELDGNAVVRIEKLGVDWFYRVHGEGFESEMKLLAVQKNDSILLIENNTELRSTAKSNRFIQIGGVNFADLANELLEGIQIRDVELTLREMEGELVTNAMLMKDYIKRPYVEVLNELKSVINLSRKKGVYDIKSLDFDMVFEVIEMAETNRNGALDKLVQLFGYEDISEYEIEVSKLLAFRKEYLKALNVIDADAGLGFASEPFVHFEIKGLGKVPVKPILRGDFTRVSRANSVEIGERHLAFGLAALM